MTTREHRSHHLQMHAPHPHITQAFGPGWFGRFAERTARFFGTPVYLIGQTVVVVVWIILNGAGVVGFDVYPFILLNLAFSLQAAYAAPLILLAETREAERDKGWAESEARHREDVARTIIELIEDNTALTQEVADLAARVEELTERLLARMEPGA
jgi:uncharacterized membrane protein